MTTEKQNIFKGIFETLKSRKAIIADNWHLHALALLLAFLMNMYGSYLHGKKLNLLTEFFHEFYNMSMADRFIHQFFAGFFLALTWEVLQALYQWLIKGHEMSNSKQTIAAARDVIVTTILYYIGAVIGILMFPSL